MDVPIVVLDNGASTVKAGLVGSADDEVRYYLLTVSLFFVDKRARVIPNAVIRSKGDKATYFGHEFERCKDYSALHYRLPFEKVILSSRDCIKSLEYMQGYLVDWDAQKAVWDGVFSDEVCGVNSKTISILSGFFYAKKG